jgi:hypothetical protein
MWCVAELAEEYIAKMGAVLALYERPYHTTEPVICLDEKPVSLHADVRPGRPARPGHIAKRDNEYKRCGTANIFAVVEPKAGRHFTYATPNRSAAHFAQVVQRLIAGYPFARKIHLVMDNLNIHCRKSLTDHLGAKEGRYIWNRLQAHYTPKHGKLAQPSGIRTQPGVSAVPGHSPHSQPGSTAVPRQRLEHQSQPDRTRIQWKFTRKAARTKFGYQRNTSKRSET